MSISSDNQGCPTPDIAAYLDGELAGAAIDNFEAHLRHCSTCQVELRTQRQLLCTLDAAFNESPGFALPKNFTRVVAAHAESNLRGVRGRAERWRALQFCAMLAVSAFALLGATSSGLVFQPIRSFVQIIARISDVLWQTVYDAAVGAGIILRMIGRGAIESPYGVGVLVAFVFLVALSLLPGLIASYHRAPT